MSMFRMQFLLLAGAVLAGASGFSFNRNDECPSVQDGVTAFEEHFGTQVSQQSFKLQMNPVPTRIFSYCKLLYLTLSGSDSRWPDGLCPWRRQLPLRRL